ncbi:Hypothetical lipoprotein [Leptospira biflexa serovar Patoc strain 'Patoc 1 (Ames)']|uniref:Uncharacterized protein n=1 Tax=Leptospira biflexa serovar Patoc (strain Patoc 1 / ATCC 23582 / Paris) TaxID=456481 RepID=B0SSR4_LEPBP|nr:hypothetical protein [Leptospira biflexa]ABZ94499.1 Hypothetical lipoprotein [Leptospira biflexa serovar Patoc strain 'Patoc 1 (Ames)']ABZ98154.1 Hypothetical protein LEPBI_I2052 [Leptospira biflexa serovar Patoc strain 'Patoc 1 (Paris)']
MTQPLFSKFWIRISLFTSVLLPFSCTTIGFHQTKVRESLSYGEQATVRVCVIKEEGIEDKDVFTLFEAWNEELSFYQLKAEPSILMTMERPGFYGTDILEYLILFKMPSQCDRLLYLKGRTWGDILFEVLTLGIFAGVGVKLEVQGAVEAKTNTKGYIKAKYISTIQLLFTSPKSTLIHEGYHMLGCGHQLFMKECYERIRDVKLLLTDPNRDPNFFPNINSSGRKILKRPI